MTTPPARPLTRRRFALYVARSFAAAGAAGCAHVAPASSSSSSSPRAIFDAYFAAAQAGDVEAVLASFAEDAEYEDVTFAYRGRGKAELRGMFASAFRGLAPVERRVIRLVADASRVAAEWEAVGTHAGPMLGVPATGRRIHLRALSLIEVKGDRIRLVTDYTDRAGLERQLGLR